MQVRVSKLHKRDSKSQLPVLVLIVAFVLLKPYIATSQSYEVITGYLCIRPEYIKTIPANNEVILCATECSKEQRCQAFTTADGPCQLFVFDACSKSVRDCSCSMRGHVFVKQQPGLQPGALCPSGYGDDLCGVKYKLHLGSWDWPVSRQKCESESGLVIMADVIDATEMDHVNMLHGKYVGNDKSFFLGGFQPSGSPEPSGGWYWIGCNTPLDGSLWNKSEPDNYAGRENTVGRYYLRPGLADFWDSGILDGGLCECVSPFD